MRKTWFKITYTCGGANWVAQEYATSAKKAWEQRLAKLKDCPCSHEWVEIEGGTGKQYKGV